MRILWHSNAPFCPTGYGQQTRLFSELLTRDHHDVIVSGFHGHRGTPMRANGVLVLPSSLEGWGNDILPAHVSVHKPDVTVLLMDIWVLQPDMLSKLSNVVSWCPVDHAPVPQIALEPLRNVTHIWAMSRFGESQLKAAGFDCDYVPHGVSSAEFHPLDRSAARERLKLPQSAYIVCMNAANKGQRKNIHLVIQAFATFKKTHPDAVLYLHTLPYASTHGLDLQQCAEYYGLTVGGVGGSETGDVIFTDPYRYSMNMVSPAELNDIYNAADLLIAPSAGEGFGIPIVEAQMAGCPVAVGNFSAMAELVGPGYLIEPLELRYDVQVAQWAEYSQTAILQALIWGYQQRGDTALRQASTEFAQQYEARTVYQTYMLPALKRYALDYQRQQRTAQRLALREGA